MSSAIQRHLKQQRAFRTLEEEVFVGLQLVSDRLMQPWAAHLKRVADLTHVQYNVLRILRGAGPAGLSSGEVGERLITRSPDVTRLIDRLENRGLVVRRQDEEDRRAVRICITDAGRDLVTRIDQKLLRSGLGNLSEPQLLGLRDSLNAILEGLTEG